MKWKWNKCWLLIDKKFGMALVQKIEWNITVWNGVTEYTE